MALAVALLIAQAKAIVGEPSAAARPDTTLRSDVAIHPGAHRGQVRVAPSGGSDVNEASTHGPTQRPKWGSDA
jgi:hypothetical protein